MRRRSWLAFALGASFAACVVPIEDVESRDAGGAGVDASSNTGGSSGATGGSPSGGGAGVAGSSGANAGTGATTNGGTGGSVGDSAVDTGADSQLVGCQPVAAESCNAVTTGIAECDACIQEVCCTQLEECLKDEKCAESMGCYLAHCFGKPATQCMIQNCQPCILNALSQFSNLSSCLLTSCGGESGKCPEFQN